MISSLISVIVPVYNTAKYLDKCIQSILRQTYKNWELILINDGSTDSSGKICEMYANQDNRIKLFHNKNAGVSSARNKGLECATGDWVLFCDSDDTLFGNNALYNLISEVSPNVDCIVGGYNELSINGDICYSSNTFNYRYTLDFSKGLLELYYPKHLKYNGYLWNRLFRTSVIKSNNLKFHEDIHYREDGLFITEFLCASRNNIVYISTPVYNYYLNPMGAMMGLKNNFSCKFISELDSRILSYKSIRKVTSIRYFRLRYKSQASVIDGYDWIIELMDKYSYNNDIKKKELYDKTINTVSLPFYYMFRFYKMLRRLI